MDIEIKLNKDFERCLNSLREEYGEDFEYINGVHPSQLDYSTFLNKFIQSDNVADSSIDPNANANQQDLRSFITEKNKPYDKLFGLNKIFMEMKKKWGLKTAREWLKQEYSRGFYLNDASASSSYFPYCYAVDLTRLATEGLFFLKKYNAEPPKHLTTFLDDVIEFVSFLSNRQSGAVGIPNIIIWSYYFWRKDCENGYFIKDKEYYLRQSFQKLIYRLNQPFLRLNQCAFTNVSIFDRPYIESLFGGVEFPDGTFAIDCIEDIIHCEKVFMEVVADIRKEQMFTFPVLTFSLLYKNGKFIDEEFARWASDHNTQWDDSNFFVSDNVGILSNCCRLLSDTRKLSAFINSIGGTALSIGSCRVSTINLARIAYETKCDKKKYLKLLSDRVTLDCKLLWCLRHIIERNVEKGLLPNYQKGALELDKQYSTLGILGLYEVIDLFGYIKTDELGNKSYTDEGIALAKEIFKVINDVKDNFTTEFSYNVESIPGENTAGVLAQCDSLLFDTNKYFIYSNQWIPLHEKCTIQEKCRLGSILDKECSGGTIAHIDVEGRFPNKDVAWKMLNYVASKGVIYFAFTTKINVCKHQHAFIGTETCPQCGEPTTDKFARVVGFYTPVSSYSKIRRQEFDKRKWFSIKDDTLN